MADVLVTTDPLTEYRQARVRALIGAAEAEDGVRPASDRALVNIGSGAVTHLIASATGGELAGYAQLDPDGSAELAVRPAHRNRGHGRELLDELLTQRPTARVWAHGDLPAARALAASARLTRARALWQMTRPLEAPLPVPELPEGVTIRTFDPGPDDGPWLAVNADAFADHPEQGSVTLEDLRSLMAQPWFDPGGFFVAERNGRMAGFHWTKIAEPGRGEVYVLGVRPDEQGTGLGRALTLIGLHHLRDTGVHEAMLYVEESSTPARSLYSSLGFVRTGIDVQYAATSP
ncbi:MAG TPA: mycothiol synthase [Jiangellaceae bacterium]